MAKRKGKLFGKPVGQVVKRPGAFTKKAQAAGMGVQEYAKHVLREGSTADTRTKRQAALAQTFAKWSKRRKKS